MRVGRVRHRSTRRRLPSTVSGASRCVTGLIALLLMVCFATSIPPWKDRSVYFAPASATSSPATLSGSAPSGEPGLLNRTGESGDLLI